METKRPWQSKSNWVGLLLAIAPFFPQVKEFTSANPDLTLQIVGGIMILLRQVTKGKITITDDK